MRGRARPVQLRAAAWRRWCSTALLTSVLLLTGCGDEPTVVEPPEQRAPDAAPSAPAAPAAPDAQPPTAAPSAGPVAAPSAGPVAAPSATTPRDEYRYEGFVTPSENIRCSMTSGPDGDSVRCDIGEKTWTSPPEPADCEFDWGNSLYLTEEESGLGCVSDAIDAVVPLPYGQTKTLSRVACTSRETGVRCEHLDSRRGFELSRAAYDVF